jgi:ubiquinone/menaquinone biosynthesis C-methylase UbiE
MIALESSAKVTGVDLTPAFIEAAKALTTMAGMAGRIEFVVGSGVDLPFADASFDLATLLHVGMNIPDKAKLFREAFRVLRPDGAFAVYDVLRVGDGELAFPVPWAEEERFSALAAPETYRSAAADAGFRLAEEEDRRAIALDFFERIRAQATNAKPDPMGLHLLMGPTVGVKTANMTSAIRAGTIAPMQMIFRKD